MKASELRIGNFVTTIDDKIICTSVKGFYGFPVNTGIINHNNSVNDFEYLKPILLTEEWLLKFGVGINSILCITCIDVLLYIEYKYNEITKTKIIHIDNKPLTHIRYVHQLQNLHFALTGEELTIK